MLLLALSCGRPVGSVLIFPDTGFPDTGAPAPAWSEENAGDLTIRGIRPDGSRAWLAAGAVWLLDDGFTTPILDDLGWVGFCEVADEPRLVVFGDGGLAWLDPTSWEVTRAAAPDGQSFRACAGSKDDLSLVGTDGAHRWTGAWTAEPLPVTVPLNGVAVWPDGVATAVGDEATVLWRRDGVWSEDAEATTWSDWDHLAVAGTSSADVWVVGEAGMVHHHDGTTWTDVHGAAGQLALRAAVVADGALLAVGDGGEAARYRLPPEDAREPVPTGSGARLQAIAVDASHLWAAGTGGTVLRLRR